MSSMFTEAAPRLGSTRAPGAMGASMKKLLVSIALLALAPWVHAADGFCGTDSVHPIDARFEQEIAQSGGVTVDMRDAQTRAYESWDKELNKIYGELMSLLSAEEKVLLRDAQRAWLGFRESEAKLWMAESISGEGTLQPIVVSDFGRELLKARVCQLTGYKEAASPR